MISEVKKGKTGISMRHMPTGFTVSSYEKDTYEENKQVCLQDIEQELLLREEMGTPDKPGFYNCTVRHDPAGRGKDGKLLYWCSLEVMKWDGDRWHRLSNAPMRHGISAWEPLPQESPLNNWESAPKDLEAPL